MLDLKSKTTTVAINTDNVWLLNNGWIESSFSSKVTKRFHRKAKKHFTLPFYGIVEKAVQTDITCSKGNIVFDEKLELLRKLPRRLVNKAIKIMKLLEEDTLICNKKKPSINKMLEEDN